MKGKILQKLKDWRAKRARRENVELFRVISNQALEEIAEKMPYSKKDLLGIKGIKEKKYAKYGEEILGVIHGEGEEFVESFSEDGKIFAVSEYLDFLNEKLTGFEARVKGEISSVDERGKYVFFGVKDKNDEALINCFSWQHDYEISGVKLEEGMEVIVWGYPNVYKPSGRFSFQVKMIELVGQGILKKAYEELRRKLETEGLFSPERKKELPRFAHRIGLITSHQGAAIGDFISNVGNYGYCIKFYDSRVEGKQAVFDLIKGVKWFNSNYSQIDILVLVRGGGSLESLQAFNTEALVREIAELKIPVLAGIGHEQDITLSALVADRMVSTPTAAALEIRKTWDEAVYQIERDEKNILSKYEDYLYQTKNKIREAEIFLSQNLENIFERFHVAKENLKNILMKIKMTIDFDKNNLSIVRKKIILDYSRQMTNVIGRLRVLAEKIALHNPERQLKLGYSLVRLGGSIVRSVKDVKTGDEINIKVQDGNIKSNIQSVIPSEVERP